MRRPGLPALLLAVIAALVLALALLWLLPDRQGLRRHQWVAPAAIAPDLSAYAAAMQHRPPMPAAAAVSRPLFTPTRRPPPPPPPAPKAPAPPPPPPPPPPPDQLDKTTLLGVMTGRGLAGVIASVDGETRVVRQGDAIGDWRLTGISDRAVTFARGKQRRTLQLEYSLLPAKADDSPSSDAAKPSSAVSAPGRAGAAKTPLKP